MAPLITKIILPLQSINNFMVFSFFLLLCDLLFGLVWAHVWDLGGKPEATPGRLQLPAWGLHPRSGAPGPEGTPNPRLGRELGNHADVLFSYQQLATLSPPCGLCSFCLTKAIYQLSSVTGDSNTDTTVSKVLLSEPSHGTFHKEVGSSG